LKRTSITEISQRAMPKIFIDLTLDSDDEKKDASKRSRAAEQSVAPAPKRVAKSSPEPIKASTAYGGLS
jgi:hypothetical protein